MAIDLGALRQLIIQRQTLVWNERNDNSSNQAAEDLRNFIESQQPEWQAVVYSNNRGLVLIRTDQNGRYEALRYQTPLNRTAARMVYSIAHIQLADWAEKKLSDTFGTYAVTALTELDTGHPQVHINPKDFPVLPDIPT